MAISSAARLPLGDDQPPAGFTLFRALADAAAFEATLGIVRQSPPRRYQTPGGRTMSVAMTNCGALGWYSDRRGYRYTGFDPLTSTAWPVMPPVLRMLASKAAADAGFARFRPEACLVNLYDGDAHMGMHQDRDESALDQPVVSVSFGRAAVFRFGGLERRDPARTIVLEHRDVVVFGGPARLCYHGVTKLTGPDHPVLGERRINLTFRQVTA